MPHRSWRSVRRPVASNTSAKIAEDYKEGRLGDDLKAALQKVKDDAEKAYRDSLRDDEAVSEEALKKAVDTAVDKAAKEYADASIRSPKYIRLPFPLSRRSDSA